MKKISIIKISLFGALVFLSAGCSTEQLNSSTARSKIAAAMFQERCNTAGEKIHRRVTDVEGVFLLKVRPGKEDFYDQYGYYDPYGRDLTGDGYIQTFLRGFYHLDVTLPQVLPPDFPPHIGYQYVEVNDAVDGKRYRYTGRVEQPGLHDTRYSIETKIFKLDRSLSIAERPRYGITYTDISTPEEKSYWIAGSSLKVIDLEKNEIIAERIGYLFDPSQGNKAEGRMPWIWAADHSCPSFGTSHAAVGQLFQTEAFVGKVLIPKNLKN